MLKTKSRWLPLAFLSVISCAAAAPQAQQMAGDWPRQIDADGATIVVYEPQLETFRGSRMTSRAAVSIARGSASEPVFGGVWLDAVLSTDADRRTVTPVLIKVTEVRFPGLSASETARLRQDLGDEISNWKLTYSVDTLLAEVKLLEEQKAAAEGLKADVPKILFRTNPAVLLALEEDPAWGRSSDSAYERLGNSAAFVVRNSGSGIHYLHIGPFWWTSTTLLGAWQPAETVPDAVADLWKNEGRQTVTEAGTRPEVVAVDGPAELVWTDGAPQYAPISGTDLLYIQNTDSDVFLDISSQTRYALFSGRWYRSPQSKEAWEFVASDKLPADFSRIPITSEKRHVLACVAGTPQAQEAVKNAAIPQTEAVKTGPAPDLQATYDGEPQFTPVSDLGVEYAVNTPYSIFRVPGRYYWCYDGIWYDAAFPMGPWYVCVGVPNVIYLIPPSCPHYYVTYCHVFGVSSDVVYMGYYPGYRGCYAWGGSVVYGTGYHYRPWIGTTCYTRPVTWGLGVRYSSSNCGWSMSVGVGATSAWGPHRPSGYRAPGVQPGAGGYWGGGGPSHTPGVGGYRNPSPPASHTRPNLYDRHPDRISPHSPGRPSRDPNPSRPDPDRTPRPQPPRDPHERPPKDPQPPRQEPDRTPRPQPPREPHERPKDPPPQHENPRTPPPPPAEHETPRTPPPPRDVPRTPPPPREHPDVPRTPPPPADRETPRTPPPPREAPRTPPPPRENREGPKTPPPQHEAPRTPPPQREAPRTPPPPREAPRTPPPPREAPRRQDTPPQRESQKDSPRSSDRKH